MRAADDENAGEGGWGSVEPEEMPPHGDADDAAASSSASRPAVRARAVAASSPAAAAAASGADPRDPRRPIDARWLRAGASWAPPRSEKEVAAEKEAGDLFLTLGGALSGVGLWARVSSMCWLGVLLAFLSLGSRKVDGTFKWPTFASTLVFGIAGVVMTTLGDYAPEAAAAMAARPNPVFGLLRGIGLPVDAAVGAATSALRSVGLAK
jgi:hypothetical protein